MRKSIILIVSILLVVMTVGSVFCNIYDDEEIRAMGVDPAKKTYYDLNGNQVTQDQFNDSIARMLGVPTAAEWNAQQSNSIPSTPQPSTPAPATATSGNSGKKQTTPKITVYFSDLYGHVIGSNQVTSGTNIAESQFPKTVEDVDGHTFDKWNYDGRALYHDFIVRAEYK